MGNDVVRSECCGLDNVDVNDAILQKYLSQPQRALSLVSLGIATNLRNNRVRVRRHG